MSKGKLGIPGIVALVRNRIRLYNAGSIAPTRLAEASTPGFTAIIPGMDSILRLWYRNDQAECAQLHHASGLPISSLLDVRDPIAFAALMHNIDLGIAYSGVQAPIEALSLVADFIHGRDEPETLVGHIDLGDWRGRWEPTQAAAVMIAETVRTGLRLPRQVPINEAFLDAFPRQSLARSRAQAADWVLGPQRGDGSQGVTWQKIKTFPQGRAASLRLGCEGAPLLPWVVRGTDLRIPELSQYWLLVNNADGGAILLAFSHGPSLRVAPAHGAPHDTIDRFAAELSLLAEELDLDFMPMTRWPTDTRL
jgi:hypothetical protein